MPVTVSLSCCRSYTAPSEVTVRLRGNLEDPPVEARFVFGRHACKVVLAFLPYGPSNFAAPFLPVIGLMETDRSRSGIDQYLMLAHTRIRGAEWWRAEQGS